MGFAVLLVLGLIENPQTAQIQPVIFTDLSAQTIEPMPDTSLIGFLWTQKFTGGLQAGIK
jgi:hypothetical protein